MLFSSIFPLCFPLIEGKKSTFLIEVEFKITVNFPDPFENSNNKSLLLVNWSLTKHFTNCSLVSLFYPSKFPMVAGGDGVRFLSSFLALVVFVHVEGATAAVAYAFVLVAALCSLYFGSLIFLSNQIICHLTINFIVIFFPFGCVLNLDVLV